MLLVYVALGGAAGAAARYALGGWIYNRTGADFPWGTLTVNLLGSFALGVLLPLLAVQPAQAEWRALVRGADSTLRIPESALRGTSYGFCAPALRDELPAQRCRQPEQPHFCRTVRPDSLTCI
ncbi:MAG TPA: CrcB family protein [Longimicrobiaceae bacterium]|nr:CrcB family protein [Longimicrobiaceae bacterium]